MREGKSEIKSRERGRKEGCAILVTKSIFKLININFKINYALIVCRDMDRGSRIWLWKSFNLRKKQRKV